MCPRESPDAQSLDYCYSCRSCFHSGCWAKSDDHSTEFRDEPCTGSSPLALHLWVAHLHDSKVSTENVLKRIASDRCHRWIGIADTTDVARDNASIKAAKPELLLYPTMTRLFTDSGGIVATQRPRKQYPRVVSFFGDTGAGKSTVVKNLIRLLHTPLDESADVPVTSPSDRVENSTSGGVHVYTDPKSLASSAPIVYAGAGNISSAPCSESQANKTRRDQTVKGFEVPSRLQIQVGTRSRSDKVMATDGCYPTHHLRVVTIVPVSVPQQVVIAAYV